MFVTVVLTLFITMHRQDRYQRGYIELCKTLPWLHQKLTNLDHEESEEMLKKACPQCLYYTPAHFLYSSNEARTRLVAMTRVLSKSSWHRG